MKSELEVQSENLEKIRRQLIKNQHSIGSCDEPTAPLVLPTPPVSVEASEGDLPSWAVGPVQVTPSTSLRHQASAGVVLGYTGR